MNSKIWARIDKSPLTRARAAVLENVHLPLSLLSSREEKIQGAALSDQLGLAIEARRVSMDIRMLFRSISIESVRFGIGLGLS